VSAPILLTASFEEKAEPYVEALKAVGVEGERIRVILPGDLPLGGLRELAAGAAGLVLGGGADVDPSRYGEAPLPGGDVEPLPERDAVEWELIEGARAARRPVWGVCRGLQVLNVFLGGSLWQDIHSQLPGTGEHEVLQPLDALVHPVQVAAPLAESSGLGRRLGRAPLQVNSRHHQAVRRLGRGLATVAASPDGLVEAVELVDPAGGDGRWWVRAVQWHPENLVALPEQRALWRDFVEEAGAVRSEQAVGADPAARLARP
jgi:putative glutamine amidotransferase